MQDPSVRDLEQFIGTDSNLEVLEACLDRTAQQYFALQRQKPRLDFGEKLTLDRLVEIVPAVTDETRMFLGVSEVPDIDIGLFSFRDAMKIVYYRALKISAISSIVVPVVEALFDKTEQLLGIQDGTYHNLLDAPDTVIKMIGYLFFGTTAALALAHYKGDMSFLVSSQYFSKEKKIRIAEDDTISAVGYIAHEYAHGIQDLKGIPFDERFPVHEGHARGVEKEVSRRFAEQYGNPAYLYFSISRAARELKDAYLFICKEMHRNPRSSLKKLKIPRLRHGLKRFIKSIFEAHYYSIGTAAMCIAEAKHGKGVYQDVLRHDYSFLQA